MISSRKVLLEQAEVELKQIKKEARNTKMSKYPYTEDKSKWYNNLGYFFSNKEGHEKIIRDIEKNRITQKEVMNRVRLYKRAYSDPMMKSNKNTMASLPLYQKARDKYKEAYGNKIPDKQKGLYMQKFEENLLGKSPVSLFLTFNLGPQDILRYIAKTGKFPPVSTNRDMIIDDSAFKIYRESFGGTPWYPDWKSWYSWKETLKDIGKSLLKVAIGGSVAGRIS